MIQRVGQVGSTQDLLQSLAAEGAPHGTAVVAVEQGAGRGSRGRAWASPPGGLWMSVLVRPPAAEPLSLRAGLAVARALEAALPGLALAIKWPNDLMLGEAKVGGLLCEARWQGEQLAFVAIGVGLNVRNAPPADTRLPATRLADTVPSAAPDALAEPVRAALAGARWAHAGLDDRELAALAARDWLRARPLAEPIAGVADGIAADGALLVRTAGGGVERLRAGTVVPAALPAGS